MWLTLSGSHLPPHVNLSSQSQSSCGPTPGQLKIVVGEKRQGAGRSKQWYNTMGNCIWQVLIKVTPPCCFTSIGCVSRQPYANSGDTGVKPAGQAPPLRGNTARCELISWSLFVSDRLSEETDQSSTQAGKHCWKVFNNGMTLFQPTTYTHANPARTTLCTQTLWR